MTLELAFDLRELVPRLCDCEYCAANPSAMVSHPTMMVILPADKSKLTTGSNGSEQATFYHCQRCDQLLAVGATLNGVSRGAVNAWVFGGQYRFAQAVSIQPRLLSPEEKAARWTNLWGTLIA